MSTPGGASPRAATLRELAVVCRFGAEPWRWNLLVAELRGAGRLLATDDLDQLLAKKPGSEAGPAVGR